MPACTRCISPTGTGPSCSRSSPFLPARARSRWGTSHEGSVGGTNRSAKLEHARLRAAPAYVLGGKQLPVPLGDDLDGAVDHFDGGLIVDRVSRYCYPGGPLFGVGQGAFRQIVGIQVRQQRKVHESQQSVAAALHHLRVVQLWVV